MTPQPSTQGDVKALLLRMEEGVCDFERWAQAVRDIGCCATDIEPGALYVMGKAMLEAARTTKQEWEACLEVARQVDGRRA